MPKFSETRIEQGTGAIEFKNFEDGTQPNQTTTPAATPPRGASSSRPRPGFNADDNSIRNISYVTVNPEDSLTAERFVVAGSGITITDNGPNNSLVFSLNPAFLNVTGSTVVQVSGETVGQRPTLNFVPSSNVSVLVTDNAADNRIDIEISASLEAGVSYVGLSAGAGLLVDGSPITSAGTFSISLEQVVTAGTYNVVTVDAYGRVISGNNVVYLTEASADAAYLSAGTPIGGLTEGSAQTLIESYGYLTEASADAAYLSAGAVIPSLTGYLTEASADVKYVNEGDLSAVSQLTNDAGYITEASATIIIQDLFSATSYITEASAVTAIEDLFANTSYITEASATTIIEELISAGNYISETNATEIIDGIISAAGYITQTSVEAYGYITQTSVEAYGYITEASANIAYLSAGTLIPSTDTFVEKTNIVGGGIISVSVSGNEVRVSANAGTSTGVENNWLVANNGNDFDITPISTGLNAISLGNGATTISTHGIAIGTSARAADVAVAIGTYARAGDTFAVALGYDARALSGYGIAIGTSAVAPSGGMHIRVRESEMTLFQNGEFKISGTQAQIVIPTYASGTTYPTGLEQGSMIFDAENNLPAFYDGTNWNLLSTSTGGGTTSITETISGTGEGVIVSISGSGDIRHRSLVASGSINISATPTEIIISAPRVDLTGYLTEASANIAYLSAGTPIGGLTEGSAQTLIESYGYITEASADEAYLSANTPIPSTDTFVEKTNIVGGGIISVSVSGNEVRVSANASTGGTPSGGLIPYQFRLNYTGTALTPGGEITELPAGWSYTVLTATTLEVTHNTGLQVKNMVFNGLAAGNVFLQLVSPTTTNTIRQPVATIGTSFIVLAGSFAGVGTASGGYSYVQLAMA